MLYRDHVLQNCGVQLDQVVLQHQQRFVPLEVVWALVDKVESLNLFIMIRDELRNKRQALSVTT